MNSNDNNTVLITGAGGFLGKAVTLKFLREGWNVRGISRGHYPELTQQGVACFEGDLTRDYEILLNAIRGCSVVIHCAAKAGVWGRYEDYYDANVLATRNVIKACLEARVARLVFTSSPSVVFCGKDINGTDESVPYPKHFANSYSKTKAMAEQLVLEANSRELMTCALRPHLIWGVGDPHLLPRLWERGPKLRIIGNGNNIVDCVHVDNAANAHYLAALELLKDSPKCAGKAYFITNDEPVRLWEFLNHLLSVRDITPIKKHVPISVAYVLATMLEVIYRIFAPHREPPLTCFVVKEMSTSHWFDISASKKDFDYEASKSMTEGLNELKAHYDNA